jgi:hypothetical protein
MFRRASTLPAALLSLGLSAGAVSALDPEVTASAAKKTGAAPWWSAFSADSLPPRELAIEDAIDLLIERELDRRGLRPAPLVSPAALLRRATLDLAGRVPTRAELRGHLEAAEADRHLRAVERLLASPAFVRHQANEFETLLSGERDNLRDYLLTAFSEQKSWDRIFREIVEARADDPALKGADAFLKRRVQDHDRLTNDVSVRFFGVNISCAQCHDHPLVPDWKQDHYFGMKSFFSRSFESGGFVAERDYGLITFKTTAGETRQAKLMFLSGKVIDEPPAREPSDDEKKEEKKRLEELKKEKKPPPPPGYSRRAQLASAGVEGEEAGYFARAIVNRLWHRFFGQGLVMPLDQMHSANPPSHPELLAWLERDLREHGYDLRRLIRGIVLSKVYARASAWPGAERPSPSTFAVASPRPLSPRQMAVSMRLACADPELFGDGAGGAELEGRIEEIERSARGLVSHFEEPGDNFQGSVDEALALSNSPQVARELLAAGSERLIDRLMKLGSDRERIDLACWNVLSRAPDDDEAAALAAYLEARADRAEEGLRQMVWALIAGAEFRFNQ